MKKRSLTEPDPSEGRGPRGRLRASGGYRKLKSFQTATLIYDGTASFCDRFVDRRSRTHDQMVQAARSGRQNIAEGSRAGETSREAELRLTNVARASLDELLLDYEDFLRQRNLSQWNKESPEARQVRRLGGPRSQATDHSASGDRERWARYSRWLQHADPAVVANALICLIHQANYLLDRQMAALESSFGPRDAFSKSPPQGRVPGRDRGLDPDDESPACPLCGKSMALRRARRGRHSGSRFWGCQGYPDCTGTLPAE